VQEGELNLEVPISTAYLLPQTQTSCDAKLTGGDSGDVSKNSFQFKNLSINWANATDTVTILQVQVYFKHSNISGEEYSCLIAGDELSAAFNAAGVRWTAEIAAAQTASNSCPISCGGFSVIDSNRAFTAVGSIKATGVQRSSSGDEKFVSGSANVKLIFQGGF